MVRPDALDVELNVDLGELAPGHHVVVTGILWTGRATPNVYYDCVPGITMAEEGPALWRLWVSFDGGSEEMDVGGGIGLVDGPRSGGVRHLRSPIPPDAKSMVLRFSPPEGWAPQGEITERIEILLDAKPPK